MTSKALPGVDEHVPRHIRSSLDDRIHARTLHDVSRYVGADPVFIDERIRELELEWDLERSLEANAALIGLLGLGLGLAINKKFLLLPMAMSAFLLQQSLRGWCPPLPLIRQFGIRTSAEIHEEIIALRILRGDFLERVSYPESALSSARSWS
jgi:hypothetical protein